MNINETLVVAIIISLTQLAKDLGCPRNFLLWRLLSLGSYRRILYGAAMYKSRDI